MPREEEQRSGNKNGLRWLLAIIILVAAFVADYYYSDVAWAIRAAVGIVVIAAMVAVILTTAQGQVAWGFLKSARAELRKVTWPTRQETVQTTIVVIVVVFVTALILWGFDTLFMWAVGLLTGQRG